MAKKICRRISIQVGWRAKRDSIVHISPAKLQTCSIFFLRRMTSTNLPDKKEELLHLTIFTFLYQTFLSESQQKYAIVISTLSPSGCNSEIFLVFIYVGMRLQQEKSERYHVYMLACLYDVRLLLKLYPLS